MNEHPCDCLVIGAGLAGLTAARAIARAGLRPAVLLDGPGASPWVHGVGAPVAPPDSPEVFLDDTLKSGVVNDPALARALCEGALPVIREIEEMGLSFNRQGEGYQLLRPLGASQPRVISIGNETGPAIARAIREELADQMDVFPAHRALALEKSGDRVCGALAYDREKGVFRRFSARAVVLAGGGFCGLYPRTTNKRDSGGDMIAMAYRAGAKLRDLEFIQFEPSGAVYPESLLGTSMITTLFYEGAVMRNGRGERFMEEKVPKDVMARRMAEEIAAGRGTPHGGVYFDATAVGDQRLRQAYPAYVERYARVGIDISKEMFEVAPSAHTSLGGVCADENGQTTVSGLFVCGEALGGLHGANRLGGSAGLETLVFGKRAGQAAAAFAQENAALPLAERGEIPAAPPPAEARKKMGAVLDQYAGVLRDRQGLERAESALEALRAETARFTGFQAMRLQNDLLTALLLVKSALCRGESLGCHTRTDESGAAEAPYAVTVRQGAAGKCNVQKEAVLT